MFLRYFPRSFAGGSALAQLFVEAEKIAHARELAQSAARGVQAFIDRHTTVAIERTVLRLLGIGAAGTRGAPLANLIVDRLAEAKVLHKGAAYWLGRALKSAPGKDPLHAIERLVAHPEKLPALNAEEENELRETMRADTRAAVEELRERIRTRQGLKASLQVGSSFAGAPWKYVIVATGNIYDDVEQARAAAQQGADVIAVIRSTAQSLLDYVPHGATTEGFGGTYATQENFHIMREALDETSRKLGRYIHLTNYSSGLCMPEIAYMAAFERLDMLLNDAMYGILFRDINMRRTFCDQYFSRRICGFAGIIINTGEDNYITTADADEAAHTVIASQLINETFAHLAGMTDDLIGFGHSFEIDPAREDTLLREFAMAMMVRELFPRSPIKYMPPTKHKEGDIFFSHAYDVMADLVAITTGQGIQLLGMMTEAMHNPFLMDRFVALKSAAYVYRGARHLGDEISFKPDGIIARRQREVFEQALSLLEEVARDGLMAAIGRARFGDTARTETGGKGLAGVFERAPDYFNPFLEILESTECCGLRPSPGAGEARSSARPAS
ncbi:MAG: lysine 5,6-aminomutase subunit alpha [Myxococcales bacterium]